MITSEHFAASIPSGSRVVLAALAAMLLGHVLVGPGMGYFDARSERSTSRTAVGSLQEPTSFVYLPVILRRTEFPWEPNPTLVPSPTHPTSTPTPTAPGPDATATLAPTSAPTGPSTRIEEDDPQVTLTGAWVRREEAGASAGALAVGSTVGDSVQITFHAEHAVLYRLVGPDGGRATVDIDGRAYGRLEFYFQEERWQTPAVFDHLGPGEHVLTITISRSAHADSSGTNVYIDAVEFPSPYHASDLQLLAEDRVNYYRDLVGLPRVELDRAINLAVQAHAEYDMQHHEGHYETFGREGFTGHRPGDRCRYFGYNYPWYEVIHYIGDTVLSIDGWMATVYHRIPFVEYRTTHIGYGIGAGTRGTNVIDTGSRGAGTPSSRVLTAYPADGQADVPISWNGAESPNPLPDKPKPVGYPVSLSIVPGPTAAEAFRLPSVWLAPRVLSHRHLPAQQGWELWTAELFALDGSPLPVYVLDKVSDPAGFLRENVVFVIARTRFSPGTTYRARVTGTDSLGITFDTTWSFTTAGQSLGAAQEAPGPVLRDR